jgi:hypothetical protein
MVDGLHILIWNRTMRLLTVALSGMDRGTGGERVGGD